MSSLTCPVVYINTTPTPSLAISTQSSTLPSQAKSILDPSRTLFHYSSSIQSTNMLRRAPTTITLTSADIEQYEANRQRKLWEQQQQQASSQSADGSEKGKDKDPNDELKPFPQHQKSKKDRIMGSGN